MGLGLCRAVAVDSATALRLRRMTEGTLYLCGMAKEALRLRRIMAGVVVGATPRREWVSTVVRDNPQHANEMAQQTTTAVCFAPLFATGRRSHNTLRMGQTPHYRHPAPCDYAQDRLRRRVHGFAPALWILRRGVSLTAQINQNSTNPCSC